MRRTMITLVCLAAWLLSNLDLAGAANPEMCRVASAGERPAMRGLHRLRAARANRLARGSSLQAAAADDSGAPSDESPVALDALPAESFATPARDTEVWPPAWALFPAE